MMVGTPASARLLTLSCQVALSIFDYEAFAITIGEGTPVDATPSSLSLSDFFLFARAGNICMRTRRQPLYSDHDYLTLKCPTLSYRCRRPVRVDVDASYHVVYVKWKLT